MSEIKYGLISETDARTLEATIDLILNNFSDEVVRATEIGLYNCQSSIAIREYLVGKCRVRYTGIDNEKDKPVENVPEWMNFIKGNSNEVYNQLEDNSQHLIFVDGLHTFAGVISDFFCYAPKVKVGGYLAFHDTGKHIDPLSGWQGVGDKNDPDMCLGGVRKALKKIGLLIADSIDEMWHDKFGRMYQYDTGEGNACWELIFDEADPNDTAGGVCVFKKLY